MSEPEFTLLGDAVWLDFVNTAQGRVVPPPDMLSDVAAVGRWARAQSLRWIEGDGVSLPEVLNLRGSLTVLAEALHADAQPPAASIFAINEQLSRNGGAQQLTRVSGEWLLRFAPDRAPTLLEAIAQSAAGALADPLLFVRRCAGETCSLFFTDSSASQGRRWCNVALCGQQVKVERRRGLLR